MDSEPLICNCGLSMSRNPHPEAGVPQKLEEVGPVWVCIPCTLQSRHAWASLATRAKRKLRDLQAVVDRSPFTYGDCKMCNKTTIHLDEGLPPICEPCAAKLESEQ